MSFDGSDSEKVLSYGDVVLRKADVDLLNGPFWLNDVCALDVATSISFSEIFIQYYYPGTSLTLSHAPMSLAQAVIAFFFEWASQERYKQLNGSILLLPGAISFLLATMGASEASVILEPLQVRDRPPYR